MPQLVYFTMYSLKASTVHESYLNDEIQTLGRRYSGFRLWGMLGEEECILDEEET